jgi:hypothetical protein
LRLNVTVPVDTLMEAVTVAMSSKDDGQLGLAGENASDVVEIVNGTTSAEGADRALSPWVFTALTSNT